MIFKDILTVVTSAKRDAATLTCAEQVATQNNGRVSIEVIGWLPPTLVGEPFVVNTLYGELIERAKNDLAAERTLVAKATSDSCEVRSVLLEMGAAAPAIALSARHADISVVTRPSKENWDGPQAILQAALFHSGRPVLVVPPDWKPRPIGRSVLIAWKPTPEAALALAEADAFIASAQRATVVTIDAKPSQDGYGPAPGADISAHLARRGMKVELINLPSAGQSSGKVLLDQALAVDADIIVMGGYGRSRMSEFIFGGMTRDLLTLSPFPLLMAH
ncbi:MAG TPA: universal stress protein [Hyphomonadaceae bacterium]|nr:universal stress protein [Hyphomonadaceae bacterium]